MKPELRKIFGDRSSLMKTGGLAVALGAIAWLLASFVLPSKVPQDYPNPPDLQRVNSDMRDLLKSADREARRQPGSAEAMGKLGLAHHANLFLDQAGRAYRIAARLAPNDYQWVYCQAFLEEENGNQQEQLKLLQQTLRLKPDHVSALLKLAEAHFKLDRMGEAEHYYEAAARVPASSASIQATFGLGRVAARRRNWGKVVEYIAPLSQAYPYWKPPYELLQEAYEALGQRSQAEEARRSGLSSKIKAVLPLDDPLNDQLTDLSYSSTRLLKRAGLLSQLGEPDRAVEVARRASKVEPRDPDIPNLIARTLLTAYPEQPQRVDEALTQLGECLRLRPEDPVPLWLFAQDFFELPKTPAAVDRIGSMMRPYAGRPEAHLYFGLLASARGEIGEAISQYQAAIRNDSTSSGVYDLLGTALVKAARRSEAIPYFQKSVQLNPMNANAHFNLGLTLMQLGSVAQGMKAVNEAIRLKPDHATAHFCLGFAFLVMRRPDDATARFREGLRYRADDAEGHFGLASALAMQHKRNEAIAELRETLRLRPSHQEAQELLRRIGG